MKSKISAGARCALLSVSLCALAFPGAASASSLLQGVSGLQPAENANAVQEDGYFRGYVANDAQLPQARAADELARFRDQRNHHRRGYDQAWWLVYAAQVREAKIRAYFESYFLGEKAAEQTVGDTLNEATCATVRALAAPGTDSKLAQAYARGVEAAEPVCFTNPDFTAVRALSARMDALERTLFDVRKKVQAYRPNPVEANALAHQLAGGLTQAVLAQVDQTRANLSAALDLDPEVLGRLNQTAATISQAIGCSTLQSRTGETFSCALQIIPAAYPLTQADTLRVIYQHQEIGPFQKRIDASGLSRAVNTYLTEVRPSDSIVRFLLANLQTELSQLDQRLDDEVGAALGDYQRLADEAASQFIAKQEVLRQQFFPRDQLEGLLDTFFQLRADIRDYREWQAGSQAERQLLDQLASRYDSLLDAAAGIELSVAIPDLPVLLPVGAPGENVTLPYSLQGIGPAYLLGADSDEVSYWQNALSFNGSNEEN